MPNRLADETSPYLRQHADNPVDWYPWCDAAFERARKEDKPVLLSVGYSACHWCHVMAHESFEDEKTAALMNRLFVNIKVDREERPDIDKIYQMAHQLIAQRPGGWPLTMFIDPSDQRPFFGGTYFPNEMRHGMPPFTEVLEKVAAYFAEQRDEIRAYGERIAQIYDELVPPPADDGVTLDRTPLTAARERFETSFDRHYGGFGGAPKFPHPSTIDRLLRHWRASANDDEPDIEALFMATLTLKRMADGGIFDHLGGGFCRYSVDRQWQIPHFEKMLYDNGPLLALYAQAHIATGESAFADVAYETADWMLSDMRADDGGFYSSRDADSDGEEGKYYVWTQDEVRELLGTDEYIAFSLRYGLDQPANFEGHWHLARRLSISEIAKERGVTTKLTADRIVAARRKLTDARSQRVPPARDEKRLTAWNALAIRGLAIAGRTLERDDFVDAAAAAVDFIHEHLFRDGRLLASYKDGRGRFSAYLDDYAFLIDALLELLQARWSTVHLEFARTLADNLLDHFEDADGGFWFTADDHEQLMHRLKPLADEAMPSGNGVAAFALNRLGCLLGETRYLESAERTLRAGWQAMTEYPHGHVTLLNALEEYLDEPEIVIIRGDADEAGRWNRSAAKLYAPRRLVFAIPRDEDGLPGALADRRAADDDTIAYRCVGTHCELPVTSFEALAEQMRGV